MSWVRRNLTWIRSTICAARECAEVAFLPNGSVLMRNSRFPDGPKLTFTPGEWDAFIGGAKRGEFDTQNTNVVG